MSASDIITGIIKVLLNYKVYAAIFIPGLIAATIVLLTIIWAERKIAARVQMRYGPLYVSRPIGGYLQLIADGIRIVFQEVIITRDAERYLYIMGPILLFTIALLPVCFIPVSPQVIAVGLESGVINVAVLIALALILYSSIFAIIIGWAVNNKFTYIGSVREALMCTAYEIPIIISVLAMIITYGTANPFEIVNKQFIPGALMNPIAFITFIIGMAMATSRFPFEIAEYEQDVILGPYTEYSGILFALSMGSSYVKLYSLSLLATLLFFGGWAPIYPAPNDFIGNYVIAPIWVFIKTLIIMLFMVTLRAFYPVIRLDQTLRLSWKGLFTLSIISLIVGFGWYLYFH